MGKNVKISTSERRKYVRIPSEHIIHYETFTARQIFEDNPESTMKSITKNLSAGGIMFSASCKFEVGTLLKLEIDLPGWERFKAEFYKMEEVTRSKPVVVLATVVRVEMIVPDQVYEIGTSFVGIDEGHRWALLNYVKTKIKER